MLKLNLSFKEGGAAISRDYDSSLLHCCLLFSELQDETLVQHHSIANAMVEMLSRATNVIYLIV